MRIAVCTCARSNGYQYLLATLNDMLLQDPSVLGHEVRIFVDELEAPALPSWTSFETADKERMFNKAYFGLKGCLNVLRTLNWLAEKDDFGILLEDDLIFAKGWLKRSLGLANWAQTFSNGSPWVTKLEYWEKVAAPVLTRRVSCMKRPIPVVSTLLVKATRNVSLGLRRWPKWPDVWGSQSYLVTQAFAKIMSAEIAKNFVSSPLDYSSIHIDHLLLSLSKGDPCPFDIYLADPCLTKHVGETSVAWPWRPLGEYTPFAFDVTDRISSPSA